MNKKLVAALLGGLIVGVLSGVFSLIPLVSLCCCLWAIVGGAVAGLIYIKKSPERVTVGDGAIVGALSGVFGGLIYLLINLPVNFIFGAGAIEEQLKRSGLEVPFSGTILILLGGLMAAVFLIILATLGGMLSVPIFEKRKDAPVPPPPPSAEPPGGGYAT
jgi:hypothetical protein